MKKILITTTYYNNPSFIDLQLKTFKKFIKEDFDFVVADDSADDTKSLVTGNLVGNEINKECDRLGLRRIKIPQSIHATVNDGGLVPNGLPANHPTERHRACLHWLLKNNKKLGFDLYDIWMLGESDLFITKPLSIYDYIEKYDILGTGRKNIKLVKLDNEDQYWPNDISNIKEITIDFMTMYLTFFNMSKVKNLEDMNIGGFAGTDTGGQTGLFLMKNNYKYSFLNIGSNKNDQVDLFAKGAPSEIEAEFVHYRGGSNWDYQSLEYYNEKLNRMLRKYIPEFFNGTTIGKKDLMSKDGEHTFLKE